MKTYSCATLAATAVLIGASCFRIAHAQVTDDARVAPMDEVQKRLGEVVQSPGDASPEAQARRVVLMDELLDLVKGDKVVLLQQWIHFLCSDTEQHRNNPDLYMALVYVLGQFDLSREDYAYGLYPLLGTTDEIFNFYVERFLSAAFKMPDDSLSFDIFGKILKEILEQGEDLPVPFMKYVIEGGQGYALIELMLLDDEAFLGLRNELGVTEQRTDLPVTRYGKLVLNEKHSRPAIASALDQLSKREEWWKTLFVAEFIKQVPEFDTLVLRDRLAQSDHPLVKKALQPAQK